MDTTERKKYKARHKLTGDLHNGIINKVLM